jgi:hypothetical protein
MPRQKSNLMSSLKQNIEGTTLTRNNKINTVVNNLPTNLTDAKSQSNIYTLLSFRQNSLVDSLNQANREEFRTLLFKLTTQAVNYIKRVNTTTISTFPFTFTTGIGSYQISANGAYNILTFADPSISYTFTTNQAVNIVQLFLVGGGQAGADASIIEGNTNFTSAFINGGIGGAGGTVKNLSLGNINQGTNFTITVGVGGTGTGSNSFGGSTTCKTTYNGTPTTYSANSGGGSSGGSGGSIYGSGTTGGYVAPANGGKGTKGTLNSYTGKYYGGGGGGGGTGGTNSSRALAYNGTIGGTGGLGGGGGGGGGGSNNSIGPRPGGGDGGKGGGVVIGTYGGYFGSGATYGASGNNGSPNPYGGGGGGGGCYNSSGSGGNGGSGGNAYGSYQNSTYGGYGGEGGVGGVGGGLGVSND